MAERAPLNTTYEGQPCHKPCKVTIALCVIGFVLSLILIVVPLYILTCYAIPVLHRLDNHSQPAPLPPKFAAPYPLPQYYQEDRGTCWDFATIGLIEQSYRANGIAKGYLNRTQYVRFSEQAYGISMIEACRLRPDVCDVVGDFVFYNNTEGGEMPWLYFLPTLYDKVLPKAVCPYTDGDHDKECPGMQDALKTNPVKFNIANMETAYSVEDSKRLMIKHNAPLGWSSLIHNVVFYFPCDSSDWADKPGCNESVRVFCPSDRFYNSKYCARFEHAMFNMDGEFTLHGNTVPEGGHAMNAVGYNDEFVTRSGHKGGFIIKNSWHDLAYGTSPAGRGARGSHSVYYWMQQISAWDERKLCPGPLNPENWASCVTQEPGPTRKVGKRAPLGRSGMMDEPVDISKTCLDTKFMTHFLDVSLQPSQFRCADPAWCDQTPGFRYFLASSVHSIEQDLLQVCMLRHNVSSGEQLIQCTPFVNPSTPAYIWTPIQSHLDKLKQDEDVCGYYFWPYYVADKQLGLYQNLFTTYFDFEWDDMSYVANEAKNPTKDYTLVKKSTGNQRLPDFGSSPFPFAKRV
jgi:hypothetical protein